MIQNLVKKPSSVISGILLLMAIFSCQNVTQPTSNSKELSSITNNNKSIEELKENKFTFSTKGNLDTYYEIINIRSGKCLEVEAGNIYNNGAKVQQWSCNNSDQQKWSFSGSQSNWRIINKKSGKVLDLDGGNSADGTKIQQWDYAGNLWQSWTLQGTSLDYVAIVNNKTGKVVDVDDGLISNGAKVHEWKYYSGLASQSWKVRAITPVQQNQNPEMGLDNQKTTSGDIEVSGWATDDKRVNRVEVAINGSLIASIPANGGRGDSKNGFGYKTKFNSKNYPNGQVKVESTAYDDEGYGSRMTTYWAINQAPEGYLDLPSQSNQSVSGSINVQGWAVDDKKINRVDIFVNGSKVGTASYGNPTNTGTVNLRGDVAKYIRSKYTNYPDTTYSGFSYQLDTTKYPNGQISVTAKAYDDNGVEVNLTGGNSRIVNVYNAPQNRAPEGYLDLPAKPTTVAYPQASGSINVQGWSVDDKKINRVDIFVNGKNVGTASYGNPTNTGTVNLRGDVDKYIRSKYTNYPDATYSGFNYQLDTTKYPNGQINITAKAYDDSGLETDLTGGSPRIVYVNNIIRSNKFTLIYINGIQTKNGFNGFDLNTYINERTKEVKYAYSAPSSEWIRKEDYYLRDNILDTGEMKQEELKRSISNSSDGFLKNIKSIRDFLDINGFKDIEMKAVYNPKGWLLGGAIEDLMEASNQICSKYNPNPQAVLNKLKIAILDEIIDGKKVILMPHSQANFFVNKAVQELYNGIIDTNDILLKEKFYKISISDMKNKIGILGLGSPNRVFNTNVQSTYYVSNLFDMVSWISGTNSSKIISMYPNNGNDNTYCMDKYPYSSKAKDSNKIERVINTLSNKTNKCSIPLQTQNSENNVLIEDFYRDKNFTLPFDVKKVYSCTGDVSVLDFIDMKDSNGFLSYHLLETAYLNPSLSKTAIINKLNTIKNNLLKN